MGGCQVRSHFLSGLEPVAVKFVVDGCHVCMRWLSGLEPVDAWFVVIGCPVDMDVYKAAVTVKSVIVFSLLIFIVQVLFPKAFFWKSL